MPLTSTTNSDSVFEDGKLKPGIYKIQNIVGQTYVDIRDHTRELCCRPAAALEGNGLWEILPSGPGYTIRRIEPGKPDQFCTVISGLGDGSVVSTATFPAAWRMEITHDDRYRGCEYVRIFWGLTNMTWDLKDFGSDQDRTPVQLKPEGSEPCKIWKLVPVTLSAAPQTAQDQASVQTGSSSLPPYDGSQCCTCSHQSTEAGEVEFGTVVTEVTVTTTTVTTRKKYRVEAD